MINLYQNKQMNYIKRKKICSEIFESLFLYKFGVCDKEISKKIIITFQINKRIILNEVALNIALHSKYPEEIIKNLITKENINKLYMGRPPLHFALNKKYSEEIIRLLITEESINIIHKYSDNALQLALENSYSKEIIKLLVTKKVLNTKNIKQNTPLHTYLLGGECHLEIIKLLVTEENINLSGINYWKPIEIARIKNCSSEVLEYLTSKKKMIND